MSEDYATATAPRHPIQNLLDDADGMGLTVQAPDGQVHQIPLDDESKAHFRDMLMSAYATGVTKNA